MLTGKVKWFNSTKGYGFIQPSDAKDDVFVHISAVQEAGLRNLEEGQELQYEISTNNKGKTSAVNLAII